MTENDTRQTNLYGIKRIADWFELIEKSLEAEAAHVGLFEHGSMIGSAREFLVKRVLKTFLPPIVHIGSGKIIDSQGNSSKQIDIIIYDSRFPVFEIDEGVGIYPIEGVIGAIEIKSTMTKQKIHEALHNTASILDLDVRYDEKSLKKWTRTVDRKKEAYYQLAPAVYVFSFNSDGKSKSLRNWIQDWFDTNGEPTVCDGLCPKLPRMIIAGGALGIINDCLLNLRPEQDYEETEVPVLTTWDTTRRFGWLASSLLYFTMRRIQIDHRGLGVGYEVGQYLPVGLYLDEGSIRTCHGFLWNNEKST